MTDARAESEQRIKDAHARGERELGVTLTIEGYGGEVLGFLITRLGEPRAQDVFSDFLEDLWRGFPAFAWRSSLRTWAYMLARHAMARYLRRPYHRGEQLALGAEVSTAAERVRTETSAHLRTDVKDRFRELRAQLSDEDQTLLILRVDRGLSWRELALVMAGPGATFDEEALETEAARLRAHFKRAKSRLKELALAAGLLPEDDG